MKIALFLPSLCGGGAERVFINLARGLTPLVESIDLVVASNIGEYANKVDDIHIIDLKAGRIANAILPLAKYLRAEQPTVLMAAMPHANLAALLANKLAGGHTKIVVSTHEDAFQRCQIGSIKDRATLQATKFGYRYAHALVAVSVGTLASERRFLGKAIPSINRVIANPILSSSDDVVPLRHLDGSQINNKEFLIVSAGRLSYEKDYELLLHAFARLSVNNTCRLVVYGEGPMRRELENLAVRLDVAHQVSLPGFTANLSDALRQADVFVLSSRWEGFGNVLVEALASGCMVVSTDCPSGPREILDGGRFGLLAPLGDIDGLVKTIQLALDGYGPVFDTTQAVSPYRLDLIVGKYIALFKECCHA